MKINILLIGQFVQFQDTLFAQTCQCSIQNVNLCMINYELDLHV